MLLHPRAPLVFGSAMFLGLAGFLVVYHAAPEKLSRSHAAIPGLERLWGCGVCHEGELSKGCLSCHVEIAGQIDSGRGYHAFVIEGGHFACERCHPEHEGRSFALVSETSWEGRRAEAFDHRHVEYRLAGKHNGLSCDACHVTARRSRGKAKPFTLPAFPSFPREHTCLGLSQDCATCHEDVHSGGLSGACDVCHGQDSFKPATRFDHRRRFPLDGPHVKAKCAECHSLPSASDAARTAVLPFDEVRGTTCGECHASPHRVAWGRECDHCHPRDATSWSAGKAAVIPELHAATGFALERPHENLACEKCHPPAFPFSLRYPSLAFPGDSTGSESCGGCHADPHGGQFDSRHAGCLDCHDKHRFAPSRYGLKEHTTYPLTGSHGAVPCASCHTTGPSGKRMYAGVSRECRGCHADPHGGQFAKELAKGDCDSCHRRDATVFDIQPFDHAMQTGYGLAGAHAKAGCDGCHREEPAMAGSSTSFKARRYRGTPTSCSSCHKDPHRGQFQEDGLSRCDRCHSSTEKWSQIRFDHDVDSRFALDGVHAKLECGECHPKVRSTAGGEFVQYRPIGRECKDCHGFKYR